MGGTQSATPEIKSEPLKANNNINETVVIPIDGSRQADSAFLWYLRHVHKTDNVVRVVHCQEYPSTPIGWGSGRDHTVGDQMDQIKREGRQLVNKYEKRLSDFQVKGSVTFESGGTPGEIIVRAADDLDATMIVMGTRGLGLIRRTILGSVSDYVIQHTKVPVTIVPREAASKYS